jgi:hypothetical protein
MKIADVGKDAGMKHMPSPAEAEDTQRRKLQYIPPIWPLLAIAVLVVAVIEAFRHF